MSNNLSVLKWMKHKQVFIFCHQIINFEIMANFQ